jgi:hypothetical protein
MAEFAGVTVRFYLSGMRSGASAVPLALKQTG